MIFQKAKIAAKVKTKSNFRGLNGQFLPVVEIVGRRVTCSVFDEDISRPVQVDFSLSEIQEFQDL